jgi:hypothetical protein
MTSLSVVTKLPEYAERNERIRSRRMARWTLERIARAEGLSHQRVSVICADVSPPRMPEKHCAKCWKRIERCSVTGLCRKCLTETGWTAIPATWTRETIVEALRRFHERYGHSPRATDLSPAMARRAGHPEQAERFHADGDMPSLAVVTKRFGGLNAAIEAAGLPSRKRGVRLTT